MEKRPIIPIAPPQAGDLEGTWAYFTLSSRFKTTVRRILEENAFPEVIQGRLRQLIDEIPDEPIRQIHDPDAPDKTFWVEYVRSYLGLNWRVPPWFTTEHYFYRRILEATGFFRDGDGYQVDPFQYQKMKGIEVSQGSYRKLLERIKSWQDSSLDDMDIIGRLLFVNLWGNQADLSLWPAEGTDKPDHIDQQEASSYILVDDSREVLALLSSNEITRVDFLIDNAGFELVTDLILSDYLLTTGRLSTVHFHLKTHPTFVSDATIKDVRDTIGYLWNDNHEETKHLGHRLKEFLEDGRLVLLNDWFWTSPLDGWKMPGQLRRELSKSDLVFSKGDAHYRRLLGDRHWAFDTPFEDILAYFPAPVVALRTSKSELIAGMKDEKIRQMYATDPDWLINGRWGLVQFYDKKD